MILEENWNDMEQVTLFLEGNLSGKARKALLARAATTPHLRSLLLGSLIETGKRLDRFENRIFAEALLDETIKKESFLQEALPNKVRGWILVAIVVILGILSGYLLANNFIREVSRNIF